ncbi:MAG TPA: hypothetical protein VJ883_11925 [Woeseiaceae bacterium]|nr:hypothetical protein [Woeseiaceae bacterium]
MNRSSSFPLLFDRRLAPDIQRIAAVLEEAPPEGMTVLRIARAAGIDMGRTQRILEGWREYFTPVPRQAGQRWRLNPAGPAGMDAGSIRRDVRRRRSVWRTAVNLAALALMVLAFLATLYYLGLAV